MIAWILLGASIGVVIAQIGFLIAAILLCFIILIQPGKGEGIASAFAGVGSESFFGTKAGQSMSRVTIVLSLIVLVLGILINVLMLPQVTEETPNDKPPATEQPAE